MSNDAAENRGSTLAAVEIVTESYTVTGSCRGLGQHLRLIDLLSNPEIRHLQLTDVKVSQLAIPGEIVAGDGLLFIDKESVVLGLSLASPEEEATRNEAHRFDQVQKEKRLTLVFAPPFRILGNIYLVKEADPSMALPKVFEGFLAMTEALVIREGENGPGREDEFIVVNGRRIDMVCAAPPGYQKVHFAGPGASEQGEGDETKEAPAA